MTCQICHHQSKRNVRFITSRAEICQRCITELISAEQSPYQVLELKRQTYRQQRLEIIEQNINRLYRSSRPAPEMDSAALGRVNTTALSEAKRTEGILTSLYRSIFDDSERNAQAVRIATLHRDEIISAHDAALAAHIVEQQAIKSEIRKFTAKLREVNARAEEDLESHLATLLVPTPTKSKEVRLLRANRLGILAFNHTRIERPDGPEYDTLKRSVRKQDQYQCMCCFRGDDKGELHVHHIIPLYKYGTNNEANLVTLCHPCHNKQHPDFKVSRNQPIRRTRKTESFIAVDIETTGFSKDDSIIEIGAALFKDGNLKRTYQSFVHTKRQLPQAIIRLTGITDEIVRQAPKADVVMTKFIKFIGAEQLVFHNASFDMRFIKRCADDIHQSIENSIVDTLKISRVKLPQLQNHKLATLIDHFQIDRRPRHRAIDDCVATGLLYLRLSALKTQPPIARIPRAKKHNNQGPTEQNYNPEMGGDERNLQHLRSIMMEE